MEAFHCIAPTIHLLSQKTVPTDTDSDSDAGDNAAQHPKLVILFPWTGANPRYIAKYVSSYKDRFPTASFMIITTSIKDLTIRSAKQKQKRLGPAVRFILSNQWDSDILVHCFSEGGSNKFIELAEAFQRATHRKFPVSSLCLDSTPGLARSDMLQSAFTTTLPSNASLAIRVLGNGAGRMIRLMNDSGLYTHIAECVILKTRRRLNDNTLLDLDNMPRCYLYSAADSVVHHDDIEQHAIEAKKCGVKNMHMVRFENSKHCGHVREDEAAYWQAIEKTWARSRKINIG